MLGTNLKLRPKLAQIATLITLAGAMVSRAAAKTPAEVMAGPTPHPLSQWIGVPLGFIVFFLLIWALSRLIHRNYCAEQTFHAEEGDRTVTPVPDSDIHHLIH